MIITEPNKLVAEVHDRMPVLLRPEQFDAWLDGSAGKVEPGASGHWSRRSRGSGSTG